MYGAEVRRYFSTQGPHAQATDRDSMLALTGWTDVAHRARLHVVSIADSDHWTMLSDRVSVLAADLRDALTP